jgi:acyl-CoA thioesterase
VAPDPDRLARQIADAMWARDRASQDLGMRVVDVGAGRACLAMTIRGDMLNGHGTCHGGFIFTLADSAFAYACNSHNHNTVAGGCTIEYLQPGRPGDLLTATAVETALSGRAGIYDVSVVNQHGELVAAFRGRSVRVRGDVLTGMHAAGTG